jgi:hypothetical protein
MNKYNEILKLREMLIKKGIPHKIEARVDGFIIYDVDGCPDFDVIEFKGTYGSGNDLLEIMGLLTEREKEHDDVVGWLTARKVMNRIEKNRKIAEETK